MTKIYRVPSPRWGKSFQVAIIIVWVVAYVYLALATLAALLMSLRPPSLPPLPVSIGLLALFTLVGTGFAFLGFINPTAMEMLEDEMVATCAFRTWRVRWSELAYVGVAFFPPMLVHGRAGYEIKYPLLLRLKGSGLPPILFLLSLCVSGQDFELEVELRRRTVPSGNCGGW